MIARALTSFAQTSQITGGVADTSRAVVPGALITVTDEDTGVSREVKTNTEGYYTVSMLPQGHYRVSAKMAGFRSPTQSGIVLDEGSVMRLDFKLEVGQLTETVEVKGESPMLEKASSAISAVITHEKVEDAPLFGRNVIHLMQLVAGVRPVNNFAGGLELAAGNTSQMSISGGTPGANNYMVDGVGAQSMSTGGFQVQLTVDATEEFRVITHNASAEFGRTGGGVITLISKSGTNQFHGTLFEFFQNQIMNANGFFANLAGTTRAPFHFNQYGATVGGPIQKNKTFFFFNWEGANQRKYPSEFLTVPTSLQRQGDFSETKDPTGRTVVIYDPATTRINPANTAQRIRDAFPGNIIPQDRIHPVARAVLPYYPAPNYASANQFTGVNNFYAQRAAVSDKSVYGIKVDRYVTSARRVSIRYTYDNSPGQPSLGSFGNIADNGNSGQGYKRNSVVLSYTDALRPDLLLELRGGGNRLAQVRIARSYGFDVTKIGLPAALNTETQLPLFPQFAMGDMSTIGGNQTDQHLANEGSYSFGGSLTKIKGAHNTKFGAEERITYSNDNGGGPNMQFNFARSFTQGPNPNTAASNAGYGLATFLLGDPTAGQASRWPNATYMQKYFGMFVQDDWKVSPKLTLNLGLRWEFQGALTDRFNAISNFNPGIVTKVGGIELQGGLQYPGTPGYSRGYRDNWFRDFGPRFGLAYQIMPKTVVRGSYGVFYIPDTGNGGPDNTGFSITTDLISSVDGGFTPYDTLTNPFPQGIQLAPGSAQGALTGLGTGVSGNLRSMKRPYNQQWNFNVQRELPGRWLVEVGYTGNRGIHLQTTRNFGYLPESYLSMGTALQQQVPNPYFGLITSGTLSKATVTQGSLLRTFPQFLSADGLDVWAGSIYHAATVRVEKRFSRGFSVVSSYIFSKLIDDSMGNGSRNGIANGGSSQIQNWDNLRAERAISNLNRPQTFDLTADWILPLGKSGSALYRKLAGGWQVNGMVRMDSGEPIAITQNAGAFGGTRPMVVGDPNAGESTIYRWFNTAAFALTPAFTYGNGPRNLPSTRTDSLFNLDFSILKNVTVKERYRVQIRGEAQRATNTPCFKDVVTNLSNAAFGTVKNSTGPREVQLGIKVIF